MAFQVPRGANVHYDDEDEEESYESGSSSGSSSSSSSGYMVGPGVRSIHSSLSSASSYMSTESISFVYRDDDYWGWYGIGGAVTRHVDPEDNPGRQFAAHILAGPFAQRRRKKKRRSSESGRGGGGGAGPQGYAMAGGLGVGPGGPGMMPRPMFQGGGGGGGGGPPNMGFRPPGYGPPVPPPGFRPGGPPMRTTDPVWGVNVQQGGVPRRPGPPPGVQIVS